MMTQQAEMPQHLIEPINGDGERTIQWRYKFIQPVNHDVDGNGLGGSRDLRIRSDQGAFEEQGGVTFMD